MYKKIMVAYDESPQAKRALASGIELAKQLGAESGQRARGPSGG